MAQLQKTPSSIPSSLQEEILVVKRTNLMPEGAWQGIKQDELITYLERIQDHQEFHIRAAMETDQAYKQIIPYLIYNYQDRYFLMQRQSSSSESRLANKYSLGIGGHMRKSDLEGASIFEWAQREFNEEINYQGDLEIEPIGMLNDDSNEVGLVHIGLVLLLKGAHDQISIKSELKSGQLVTLEEIGEYYPALESWSQMVFDFLKK